VLPSVVHRYPFNCAVWSLTTPTGVRKHVNKPIDSTFRTNGAKLFTILYYRLYIASGERESHQHCIVTCAVLLTDVRWYRTSSAQPHYFTMLHNVMPADRYTHRVRGDRHSQAARQPLRLRPCVCSSISIPSSPFTSTADPWHLHPLPPAAVESAGPLPLGDLSYTRTNHASSGAGRYGTTIESTLGRSASVPATTRPLTIYRRPSTMTRCGLFACSATSSTVEPCWLNLSCA